MSQENIEVMRRVTDAWNRGDLSAFLQEWHPECEWLPAFARATEGSGAIYRRHEGLRRGWRGFRKAWQEFRFEIEEARQIEEGGLFLRARIHARARSGVELDSAFAGVVRFQDGKIISLHDWLDPAEALEAAGLRD